MALAVFDIGKYVDGFGNVVEPKIYYSDGTIRSVHLNVPDSRSPPLVPPPPVVALASIRSPPAVCLFPFMLLTDILLSHPPPFKYTIKPRSEKSATLVASVEL